MTRFDVPDMSCGHCRAAIEKAIRSVDPLAKVDCDLNARIVGVLSALDPDGLVMAMREAGYKATPLAAAR
ncbi:hypothetical protein DEA8626_01784 [Defluviimonas aquaemixtae]|uniref:HMA domain-containing protein n=1 Tax=Albidovulum aquaemixtae TaxID=1542388 RepID=A0A2R8B6S3_9RHOB|nr:heavy-metal-associated domain-containing protein [Defluviimonas aquaemixtae]SPH18252.1 hypothetical protein DEA8626_01784 [Defluviimonas aquaemixtae]